MHSRKHFFAPQTESEQLFNNYTMSHTAEEIAARRPSQAVEAKLRSRLAARRAHWDDWIMRKKTIRT